MNDFPEFQVTKLNRMASPMPEYKRNTLRRKKAAVSSTNVKFKGKSERLSARPTLKGRKKNNGIRSIRSMRSIVGAEKRGGSRLLRQGSARSVTEKKRPKSKGGNFFLRAKSKKYTIDDIEDIDTSDKIGEEPPDFEPSDDVYRSSFLRSMNIDFDDFDLEDATDESDAEGDKKDPKETNEKKPKHAVCNYTTLHKPEMNDDSPQTNRENITGFNSVKKKSKSKFTEIEV